MKIQIRRKKRVNKAVKLIALIQDASDTYIFCNNYLKHSFVNFLSIFLHFIACMI